MKTLVYFASGPYREEYQTLDFDIIYLIDDCFKIRNQNFININKIDKVICVGMDCLESIEFLKNEHVKIDYLVCLNEGLYEGGGRYPINSDMFLGYAMPLLKDKYIHIMDKSYYQNRGCNYSPRISMDLPFEMDIINDNDNRYIKPYIFTHDFGQIRHPKVIEMTKIINTQTIEFASGIKLSIIHDSIWNYYEELDSVLISIRSLRQNDFFTKLPKVLTIDKMNVLDRLQRCFNNKKRKIGFTPWAKGKYDFLIDFLKYQDLAYPVEIVLFHLNKDDYKQIKKYASKYVSGQQ